MQKIGKKIELGADLPQKAKDYRKSAEMIMRTLIQEVKTQL
jgi:hypothetical protein